MFTLATSTDDAVLWAFNQHCSVAHPREQWQAYSRLVCLLLTVSFPVMNHHGGAAARFCLSLFSFFNYFD